MDIPTNDTDRFLRIAQHAARTGDSALWAHALIAAYGHRADPAYPESVAVCAVAEKTIGVNTAPAGASE